MWIKIHTELTKYIPEDNKYHDVQIINGLIWVDGRLKNPSTDYIDDVKIFNRILTEEEIKNLSG